jgi:hypothetical protein
MYFWVGVSAIAGALRRKVWIDQAYFRWHPNMYIILVAPPGIVSKSTTASVAMRLLRRVPGIKFGPDVVTWQALVGAFAEATEKDFDDLVDVWNKQDNPKKKSDNELAVSRKGLDARVTLEPSRRLIAGSLPCRQVSTTRTSSLSVKSQHRSDYVLDR